jgi:uncharacterized protein (TIGR02391 family)
VIEDVEWALGELRRFEQMTVMRNRSTETVLTSRTATASTDSDVTRLAPVVEMILDRVTPRWREEVPLRGTNRWTRHRDATLRAITILERQEELHEKLGDKAPTLDASHFHRWAWDGARSMWSSRHYSQGVFQALMRVNAETQNKVGITHLDNTKLFQQVFSTNDPKPGDIRLRLGSEEESETYRSLHRGVAALAEGLFAGIRNVTAHVASEDDGDEQRALEQLAAVSMLARLVDDARLVRTPRETR